MEDSVLLFVKNRIGCQVINKFMTFDNIGVDGLDAEIFFNEFSKEFHIDMTEFDFERYFLPENPFINLISRIIKYKGKIKVFTFNHLIKVAENRKWFDPQ